MKKLIFSLAIASACLFSCSSDDKTTEQQSTVIASKDTGTKPDPQKPTEAQKTEAVSDSQDAVYEMVTNGKTGKVNVKFCKDYDFTLSSGSAYAEVTLTDGSVHYTFVNWFTNSLGKHEVKGLYMGTSAPAGSGC